MRGKTGKKKVKLQDMGLHESKTDMRRLYKMFDEFLDEAYPTLSADFGLSVPSRHSNVAYVDTVEQDRET